jgi:poly-gamma-glutamate capsule biosynthesis protein CapA/YwtB (metallophosphatase superfamily)
MQTMGDLVFLCGDVMTGRGVDQILPHPSSPELYEAHVHDARDYVSLAEDAHGPIASPVRFGYVWGDALEELRRRSPSVRIVNLETSVTRSNDAWPDKGVHYRMHPRNVPCLRAAEIDVCVLANNHVLDWGRSGLVETLDVLHAAGIETAGAGCNAAEADEVAAVDITNDRRVLVVGVTEPSSGVLLSWEAKEGTPGVALRLHLDDAAAQAIGDRLARARRPGDVSIVSIHWGTNWGYEVPDEHVRFAHALIDRGVDVVHGHSSHHPRPIEIYEGKPILYGCGDFVTDYEGIGGHETYRDDLVLMYLPTPDDSRRDALRMVPMRLRRMRLERASRMDASWLSATLARVSRPFGTDVAIAADGSLVARAR